jgi:hypothetical protein
MLYNGGVFIYRGEGKYFVWGREWIFAIQFMEAFPLCDNIEVCIFLRLDTTIIHNSKYYKLIVRGYMFRLLMQPSSGQL